MSVTSAQFKKAWADCGGNLKAMMEVCGYSSIASVSNRRKAIETEEGITLASSSVHSERNAALKRTHGGRRIELDIQDGVILIGSDAHIWPGPLSAAQRGFIELAKRLKPDVVVMNGDVFDGARISRHPAGIWDQESRPDVKMELEACQNFLAQVEKASISKRIWTYGNHDARFEYRLAALTPEYQGVPGFALKDHFPEWRFCMAVFVNDNLVIKHRHANGMHAVYNNTLRAGRSTVTGHLHSGKVIPWTDYNGTRYGVDCGSLADQEGKQFDYTEEGPSNHRSSFCVVTVRDGRLLYPEICQVWDETHVEFRGELICVPSETKAALR